MLMASRTVGDTEAERVLHSHGMEFLDQPAGPSGAIGAHQDRFRSPLLGQLRQRQV
jgi:hypothetical protein